jgi:hypothetical protein
MFFPRPNPFQWLTVLLMLPDPNTLLKYSKATCTLLKAGRKCAKQRGKEHRRSFAA